MKKALSMIVTALVALSFAGVVLAEEPAAMPAGHPPVKAEEKKPEGSAATGGASGAGSASGSMGSGSSAGTSGSSSGEQKPQTPAGGETKPGEKKY